jgi:putative hemolysin
VPIYIEGGNSNLFYNFALIRKKLGIKTNLEMFLLPHESYNQKGKTIKLIFGEKIPYQYFDKSNSHKEWAAIMREHIYTLKIE